MISTEMKERIKREIDATKDFARRHPGWAPSCVLSMISIVIAIATLIAVSR